MNLTEKYIVTINEPEERFEVELNGDMAYIDYRWYNKKLILLYVFVPIEHRGKGVSNVLIQYALEYAMSKEVKINIYCPYIAKYVRMHPEYANLVDQ